MTELQSNTLRRAWWALAVFALTGLLSYTDRQILSLLVDAIRVDVRIDETQMGLLQGLAFAVVYSIAGLPLGRFADVLPRKRVIIAGVAIWSVATGACALAHSFAGLFVARMFVGIGEAALAPAAVSIIADSFPSAHRGAAISVFVTGMIIGAGAALTIGGGLITWADRGLFAALPVIGTLAPWRATLLILAAGGGLVMMLLLSIQEPARETSRDLPERRPPPLTEVRLEFNHRRHILLPLYAALALTSVADSAILSWSPAFLSRDFALSAAEIGASLGGIAMTTGIGGSLAGGFLSDWLSKGGNQHRRVDVALIAAVIGILGTGVCMASSKYTVLGFFFLWTLMSAGVNVIGITAIQDIVPGRMRGIGTSLVSLGNVLIGSTIGVVLTAVLTERFYRDDHAVGLSISTVMVPSALLAAGMLWRASAALRAEPHRAPI